MKQPERKKERERESEREKEKQHTVEESQKTSIEHHKNYHFTIEFNTGVTETERVRKNFVNLL